MRTARSRGLPQRRVRCQNGPTMLKVLGRISSINVRKVLWTCDEIGIPFEREDWGLGFKSPQAPEFLALNPNAKVPVIREDDGFVLWESNTICRYLVGRAGRDDLLPTEPRARAGVEQWIDWQSGDLNTAARYAFWALLRRSPAYADPAAIEASRQGWNQHMQILEAHLQRTGDYVAGATFTLADIMVGLSVHRWSLVPMERPDLPALTAYRERLKQREAYARYAAKDNP